MCVYLLLLNTNSREYSVKPLRSPRSDQFSRYGVLRGGKKHRASFCHQREEMKKKDFP